MLPSIERADAARTIIVPRVQPHGPSRLRTLLPWIGFGLLSVVVIAGTSLWSASLRTAAHVPNAVGAAVLPSVTTTPTAGLPTTTATSAVRQQMPPSAATRRTVAHVVSKPARVRADPVTAPSPAPVAVSPISTPAAATPVSSTSASSTPTWTESATSCAEGTSEPACVGRGTPRPLPAV